MKIDKEERLNSISFFIKLFLATGAIRIVYDGVDMVLQLFVIFMLYIVMDIITGILRFIFRGGK